MAKKALKEVSTLLSTHRDGVHALSDEFTHRWCVIHKDTNTARGFDSRSQARAAMQRLRGQKSADVAQHANETVGAGV